MGYRVQMRYVLGRKGDWVDLATHPAAAWCREPAKRHATLVTETRIVPRMALVNAAPLCRLRRSPTGTLLVIERGGRRQGWHSR